VVEAGRRRVFGIPQLSRPRRSRNSAVRYRARRSCASTNRRQPAWL